jgi:probable rRNA maturation factor
MLKINLINQADDRTREYRKTLDAVLRTGARVLGLRGRKILNVILVDNAEIRRLNREFRGLDKPTDVLSFDNAEDEHELGDVFISLEKAREQAAEYGHSFERELGFLACHGFLHCNGYDHQNPEEETTMFALQETILQKIHLTR